MIAKKGNHKEVLLVEDNQADVYLVREALREIGSSAHINVTQDGVKAISFLRQEGKFIEAPRPDLILLDLNLPKKNGHKVLQEIRADEDLRQIPVLVLTTSEAKVDIAKAYDLGANCYLTKPPDLDSFFSMMQAIEDFWMKLARLPPTYEDEKPLHEIH
jgi:CheY-like chemotaxis protein